MTNLRNHNRMTRRRFLTAGTALSTISVLPAETGASDSEPVPLEHYQPSYLTRPEWAFVMAAVARLIPSDASGPGAIEARVPVYIDRQLAGDFGNGTALYLQGPFEPAADPAFGYQSPLTPAEIYRQGIAAFDAWCLEHHGTPFKELGPDDQDAALTALEKGDAGLPPELRDFFSLLLQNTREGFFADPKYGGNHNMLGWLHIGFPGARAAYLEWTDPRLDNVPYPLGPVSISGQRA